MKKFSSILLTAALSLCVLFPASGCGDKGCKHNVGEWEIVTPATCGETGLQEGICGICLKTVSEVLPIDPENHPYGEWDITQIPTEEQVGSATKTCALNDEHVLTITLPVLSDLKYLSTITTRPTVAKDGVRSYTMKHETGNVTFTQPVPATGIQSMRDAVDLGSAAESRALIRSASGTMGYKKYEEGLTEPSATGGQFNHSYTFGADHTHVVEEDLGTGDLYNRWYFKDDQGQVYGLTDRNGEGKILNDLLDTSSNEKYLNGSRIYIAYYGGANTFGYAFGVEDFLSRLYATARMSTNGDFTEWSSQENEKTVYSFTYGEAKNSGKNSAYFTVTTTSFTLSEAFAIEELKVQAITYVNNNGGATPIETWSFNDDGYARVNEGKKENGERYVTDIQFTQTPKDSADVVAENPHSLDKIYVQSFDITYHDEVLGEGDYAEFAAGEEVNTGYVFSIANVQPETAITTYTFDSFSFYLRTKNELGETVDLPINESTIKTTGMTTFVQPDTHKFFLRAQRAGEQTVVVKSRYVEREIHCKIDDEAPRAIYPTIYQYKDGEYYWDYRDKSLVSVTGHYVHQPFYFTADVPLDQANYASSSYTFTITKGGKAVSSDLITATSVDSRAITQFTPIEAGSYTIKITSKLDPSVSATMILGVKAAPEFAEIISKSYSGGLSYPYFTTAKVEFSEIAAVSTGYTFKATVTLTNGSFQVLSCEYNTEDRQVTSSHASGNAELGFILSVNEAYDLMLNHPDGFGGWERVLLLEIAEPTA